MPAKPTTATSSWRGDVMFEKGKVAFQRGWAGMGVVLNLVMAKMLWPLYRWMQSTMFASKKLRDSRRKSLRNRNKEDKEEDKSGKLHVIMKGANNLPVTDLHGSSDAFGKVTFGGRTMATEVVTSLNPEWGCDFEFDALADSTEDIILEVWDQEEQGDNEFVGRATISFKRVANARSKGVSLSLELVDGQGKPLKDALRKNSKLTFEAKYTRGGKTGAEWLNGAVRKAFASVRGNLDEQISTTLSESFQGIADSIPLLSELRLNEFSLGSEPPWIMHMSTLPTRSDQDVQVKCRLRWTAGEDMALRMTAVTKLMSVTVEVADLEIEFPAWIQARVQSGDPALTSLALMATEEPDLEFDLKVGHEKMGLVSTSAVPGLQEAIEMALRKVIEAQMLTPNRVQVPFCDPPVPLLLTEVQEKACGKLTVKVLSGAEMPRMDEVFGWCDAYVTITVGGVTKRTKACKQTETPKWNSLMEFMILDPSDTIRIEVLDDDEFGPDDSIGKLSLCLEDIALQSQGEWIEDWYDIIDAESGKIHLALAYEEFSPCDGPEAPGGGTDKPEGTSRMFGMFGGGEKHGGKAARIRIVSANNLPTGEDSKDGSMDPFFTVELGGQKFRSRHILGCCDPSWDEEFTFDGGVEGTITVSVFDYDKGHPPVLVGTLILPLPEQEGAKGVDKITAPGGVGFVIKDGVEATVSYEISWVEDEEEVEEEEEVNSHTGRVDFANDIIAKLWRVFHEDINKAVTEALGGVLKDTGVLELMDFDIGFDSSPWLMTMHILPTRADADLQLKGKLRWESSGDMVLKIKDKSIRITVHAKELEIEFPAWIQVWFGEGGLSAFSIMATQKPTFKFKMGLVGVSFSMFPGWDKMIDSTIRTALNDAIVAPNRIRIDLAKGAKAPEPSKISKGAHGRISIKVLEAWGLVDLDAWGTIDPFCTVRVESKGLPPQERRTAHENDTDCPEWNHYFEFLASDDPDGTIQRTVFDQDFTKVDLLGSVTVKFSEIMAQEGWQNLQLDLHGCKGGVVSISVEYAIFVPDEGPCPAPPPKPPRKPKNLVENLGDGLGQGIGAVGNATFGALGGAGNIVHGVGKEVGSVGETTFRTIGDGAHGINRAILGEGIADGIKHNVDGVTDSVKENVTKISDGVGDVVHGAVDKVADGFGKIFSGFGAIANPKSP